MFKMAFSMFSITPNIMFGIYGKDIRIKKSDNVRRSETVKETTVTAVTYRSRYEVSVSVYLFITAM